MKQPGMKNIGGELLCAQIPTAAARYGACSNEPGKAASGEAILTKRVLRLATVATLALTRRHTRSAIFTHAAYAWRNEES